MPSPLVFQAGLRLIDGSDLNAAGLSRATQTTSDPTVSSDVTTGISPGSQWLNTLSGKVWRCLSNAQGAAVWVIDGTVPFRNVSAAGVSPGATAADNVLMAFSLPAGFFQTASKGLWITAQGKFGSTANNKDVKIIFNPSTAVVGSTVGSGGTTIADTGVVATNGGGWSLAASIFKVGAYGANTQVGLHQQAQVGGAVAALLAPITNIAAVETGAILVALTGNAATATTDIVANFFDMEVSS